MRGKLAQWVLALLGWHIESALPRDLAKYVMIAAPHTSYQDFFLGILTRAAIGRKVHFLAKKSLFGPPLGWLMRWFGGQPVDRNARTKVVQQVVDQFHQHDAFAIAMAPEGTRRKVNAFRSGFYHIAKGAGVPIIMTRLNYGERKVEISGPFYPGPDMAADLQKIWDHFKGVKGCRPELGIT